jgi:hypothetical protein
MSVRRQEEKNIRKLSKIGKQSVGITLPIEEVRKLGWREKQKLVVKRIRGGFEIKDWKPAGRLGGK